MGKTQELLGTRQNHYLIVNFCFHFMKALIITFTASKDVALKLSTNAT